MADKLKMETKNLAEENYRKLIELFPNIVTEATDENGNVVRAIDADLLQQEINEKVVEGSKERYVFTWPDKKRFIALGNEATTNTLRLDKEKSVGRDGTAGSIDTGNIYIEGDNLEALKLLRETYLGKVKMIYIDPPYNTGNDSFVYDDDSSISEEEFEERSGARDEEDNLLYNFKVNNESNGRFHTDWLNMMYPRLALAKDLLSNDGVIFISIDDNEVENLKKICDEIFGSRNFICQFIWRSTAGSNTGSSVITLTEYILCYEKQTKHAQFKLLMKNGDWKYEDEYLVERGKYELQKLDGYFTQNHFSPSLVYPIILPDGGTIYPGGGCEPSNTLWNWRWSQTKVEWGIQNGYIEFKKRDEKWTVYFKNYEKVDNSGNKRVGSVPYKNMIGSDIATTATGTQEIAALFERQIFEFPKASNLIKYFTSMLDMDKDSIVLDFFSGSATTAHAVMQLNAEDGGHRRFILVQLPEQCDEGTEAYKAGFKNICEIGEERIRRAGKKIKEESPLTTGDLDIGFRVYRVDDSNMKDVYYKPNEITQDMLESLAGNIKEGRTGEDLLIQIMLELGVDLSSKIEETEISGKKVFSVSDGYMMACFDNDVTDDVVTQIAKTEPYYAVFRDSGMVSDSVMTNYEQIFKTYSPKTIVKVL